MRKVAVASVVLTTVWFGSTAASARRYPVMGCWNFETANADPHYAPFGRCSLSSGGADVGIYHVHWRHWGRGLATGRGYFYDGLGFLHPAKMWIYAVVSPDVWGNCDPNGGGAYSVLHVVWRGVFAAVWRPGGNHRFDVEPLGMC